MIRCPDCGAQNIAGAEDCESCSAPLSGLPLPPPGRGLPEKILAGTLRDLKPVPARTVDPAASVADAVALMREKKVGCLLVVKSGKIEGGLTERDLLQKVAGLKDPAKLKVRDVMHTDFIRLKAGSPVAHAVHSMAVGGHRHLPVEMDDGSLGIISARDLLRYLS